MNRLYSQFGTLIEVAELSPDAVIIYSLTDKKIVYSNPSSMQQLRLDPDASPQDIQTFLAAIAPEDRAYARNAYSDLLEHSVISEAEIRLTTSGDKHRHFCCNAYVVGNESAIVVSARDITKPRKHEDYLVEFGARKDTVLDTLTHHISGALNLMKNLSHEAAKAVGTGNDKQISSYLSLLNENNSRCLEIIDDLMNNEHERSPGIFVKKSRSDIIEIVSFIYQQFQQTYQKRKFLFHRSNDSLYISADEVKFLQVVNNLISNAIKFSLPEATIEISVDDDIGEAVISVRDHGIGIPESLWPFLFQRHTGTERTGLNGEKPSGLGLWICKNLVELMGGRIWFESKEGEGSVFYFSVPK